MILFKFDELSEKDKAIRLAKKYFSQAGANVVNVDVPSLVKRTSGISYKELQLSFADSQTITFRIKNTGDIYQVLLNGKLLPLKNQTDHEEAIAEIAQVMDRGRAAFQKKLAAVKVELPPSIKTAVPTKKKLLENKVASLTETIAELDLKIQDFKNKMSVA